jgi:signal peptidase I
VVFWDTLNEQDFPSPLAVEPTSSADLVLAPSAALAEPALEASPLTDAPAEPPSVEAIVPPSALAELPIETRAFAELPIETAALAELPIETGALAEPPIETGALAAASVDSPSPEAIVPAPAIEPVVVPADQSLDQVGAWKRMGREVVAGVQTLLSAAVYATLIVTFGFQVARVDGLSMAPTLEDHDRLIVNKLVYEIGEPLPGDIVMLYYPLNPEKMFVKRVIAKEGDTVRIVDGRVYVNDIPLHDDYVPAEFRSHDDWGPQVIQQGYYFVMGDHRNNSSDSRHWGPVPKKYIVGKVKVRWWPIQDARIF